MCDTFDVPCHSLHATSEYDGPQDTFLPKTPPPDSSRTLCRTTSYASIDTVRPSSNKGVRRRIDAIADNLKHKSTKKKQKKSSTQNVPENVAHDVASDSKSLPSSKATRRGRKATAPLQDSSHKSEEESVLAIADRLHSGVPSGRDLLSTSLGCETDRVVDKQPSDDFIILAESLNPGAPGAAERQDTFQSIRTPKIGVEDVQLNIQPSESDITIWDGLQVAHHLFKCRVFLQCTTHSYDSVSLPDVRRVEMNCNTHPAGLRYAGPPVLQTAYEGASPGWVASSSAIPNVDLAAGIHMDRFWRTIANDDGTWGWYRDAFVPLSSRLFDKTEYREFKLVSRVLVEENCVEDELTFGISMLLRGVDMK